jgi:hypothetical protein
MVLFSTSFTLEATYMDKFVISRGSTYQKDNRKDSVHHRYEPYPTKDTNNASSNDGASRTPTRRTLTRHLLNTLSDELNPITHSDIGLRSG